MNIEYSKQGDYYIPNIVAQKNTNVIVGSKVKVICDGIV